jgi:hypothetical protein
MKVIFNNNYFRCLAVFVFCAVCGPALWAGGWKDQIETVTAEGGEVWDNDYDVTKRKKGIYNFIVYARDRAGNEAISGPFNVKVDPNSGLPIARVLYPENNAIVRQNINVLGVASGRYGIGRVTARLDDGEYTDVTGTDYWNQLINFASIADGRHTLRVQATDTKGVLGPEQKLDFILDTTAPQIELTSHSVGDIVTGSVNFKGRTTDPNGIALVEYSEDGKKFNVLTRKSGRVSAALGFSLSVNTKKLPDGPLVYYLRVVDATGIATVKPYLFFVSNNGPDLEVYTPAVNEDVYDTFYLSGRAYDKIGLSALYYEWGRIRESIEMRSGDPFWGVPLKMDKNSPKSIKVVAVDKVGNSVSVTRKLEDRRKIKTPVLVIDYPPPDALAMLQRGMPSDTAIYGHIAPGSDPGAVSLSLKGFNDVEALSGFRIDPYMILPGKRVQTLKLTPIAADGTQGVAVNVRYLKTESLIRDETRINITTPVKNSWLSGSSFVLRGNVPDSPNAQLEYRLDPTDSWHPLRMDISGGFFSEINMSGRAQGPVHLELRTVRYGEDHFPLYHPFNWAADPPLIRILAPTGDHSVVYGSKTVTGVIEHTVPVQRVTATINGRTFADVPFAARHGRAWFEYFCDFNTMEYQNGQLIFYVIDAGGTEYEVFPEYTVDPDPPIPVIIVNTPVDQDVITAPFEISGLAYYDVDISAVYWRILGPKMESLSRGAAGEYARRQAAIYEANPDVPFQQLLTSQNFQIPIDFSVVTDGEYTVEIYAADLYGMQSEVISRTIKVSTASPVTEVRWPIITRYNQKAIMVRGFSSDANIIDSVIVSMDNGNTYQKVELSPDGSWELALNTAAYTDGIYSALIQTADKYGVTTFSNAMVNIDNTTPELYLTSPVDGQHVGTNMQLMGRVADNITLKSLSYQVISAENPRYRRLINAETGQTIFDTINLSGFPRGAYILRIVAVDLADNETLISRKIFYDPRDDNAQIAIYNPLPGEIHSGPIHIVGIVTGSFQPNEVRLMMNGNVLAQVPVERYGIFRYDISEGTLGEEGVYRISASYNAEGGSVVSSPEHTVFYSAYGPILQIESHHDGDVITARPWLTGQAWIAVPEPAEDAPPMTRRERSQQREELKVTNVTVSYDNGRSFYTTKGDREWKVRLETSELPRGPQPVLVRAIFANGLEAVRRIMLNVDTTLPQVETVSPPEDSLHRDNIRVFGTAGDNYELADVDISLRPHDKFFYSVPGAIKGMYFDVKGLGATWFDVGLGLSLFNDNVRLQFQFGLAPGDGTNIALSGGNLYIPVAEGGRYPGQVYGIKLLANIFNLPFAYLFGLDWAFYSMNVALGANFSYFTMAEWQQQDGMGKFMGAVVAQWDVANVNMQFFNPNWKYFRNYALYLEPEVWFTSTDAETYMNPKTMQEEKIAKIVFRMTIGMRINWF